MRTERSAFTLIELLVVIAIIAILAAILFPVFVNAKERGRQTRCLCNLKQLMMAVREYCDDHNGYMPFGEQQRNNTIPDWAGCYVCGTPSDVKHGGLWPYVRSRGVYVCPTDINTKLGIQGWTFSYSMNYIMSSDPDHLGTATNLDVESAGRASRVLILVHEYRRNINDGFFAWGNTCDFPSSVHWNGTTVVYADTHAKWVPYSRLIADENNGYWWPNSRGGK
jgi:prepilin-type N-terminal cleavage/methylation domain-containing protein